MLMAPVDHFHVDLHWPHLTVSWLCHIQGEQLQLMPKLSCAEVLCKRIHFFPKAPNSMKVMKLDNGTITNDKKAS